MQYNAVCPTVVARFFLANSLKIAAERLNSQVRYYFPALAKDSSQQDQLRSEEICFGFRRGAAA